MIQKSQFTSIFTLVDETVWTVALFHSHPHDNDCVPSRADREMVKRLKSKTGQSTSQIVTPNGRTVTFNEHGVISTGTVPNLIDESLKKAYLDLWR